MSSLYKYKKTKTKARWKPITANESKEGETIETKVNRITNNKEPIKDGAPVMYTERKEGVLPATNIRTDRWEIAVDAMDKVSKSYIAQRDNKLGDKPPKIEEDLSGTKPKEEAGG